MDWFIWSWLFLTYIELTACTWDGQWVLSRVLNELGWLPWHLSRPYIILRKGCILISLYFTTTHMICQNLSLFLSPIVCVWMWKSNKAHFVIWPHISTSWVRPLFMIHCLKSTIRIGTSNSKLDSVSMRVALKNVLRNINSIHNLHDNSQNL